MVVHMSQILCSPVTWILKLRSILCILQTRPPLVRYFTFLLSCYTYKCFEP